jgi:hypothetical protein
MTANKKATIVETPTQNNEAFLLEQRKVKALEKIGTSLDALTIWFEEIDKDDWSNRLQYYLAEWLKSIEKDA